MSFAPRPQPVSSAARVIEGVPARSWADNSCGAGALSEVLNYLGDPITEARLSESLARSRNGGVITVDLLLAARNRGFDAQIVRGDLAFVQSELEQRHPLILMLRVMDAPGTEDDLFHYVVLSGIDSSHRLVRMHYGDSKMRWVPLQPLARSWEAGGYATFLIGPGKKRPATQDDLRRAVVLEEEGKTADAIALYRHFLNSHPSSTVGWTNLANAHAAEGETQLAEVEYRNALFIDRDYFEALNNLAWLLLQQKRFDEAEVLARRAAGLNHTDRNVALDTLAQILLARAN